MEEFIQKVAAMRRAQRDYFKSRDRYNLREAKRLEAEVDAELSAMDKQPAPEMKINNQAKLF